MQAHAQATVAFPSAAAAVALMGLEKWCDAVASIPTPYSTVPQITATLSGEKMDISRYMPPLKPRVLIV